jgi:site-specific DNA recombinase
MLRNPYYMGIVPYMGIHYEGKHPSTGRTRGLACGSGCTGEPQHGREGSCAPALPSRHHFFCSDCGGRLVYSENKGNGGIYAYYFCVKKKTKANNCTRRAVRVERIEEALEAFYGELSLPQESARLVQAGVEDELSAQVAEARRGTTRALRRKEQLEAERQALLRSHYAGAIPQDLLASEMQRFTRELAEVAVELAGAKATDTDVLTTLQAALRTAERVHHAYLEAPSHIRRQINQGFFTKVWIGEDGSVERVELQEPFAAVMAGAEEATQALARRKSLGGVDAQGTEAGGSSRVGVGAEVPEQRAEVSVLAASFMDKDMDDMVTESENKTTQRDLGLLRGVNERYVVEHIGFEPMTSSMPWKRASQLRQCPFLLVLYCKI